VKTIGLPITQRHPSLHAVIVLGACLGAAVVGYGMGNHATHGQTVILAVSIGGAATAITMLRPIVGLGLFAAGASVADILPNVSIATSALVLVGAATFFGFILSFLIDSDATFRWHSGHFAALAFIAWFSGTNIDAAIHGSDRNWLLTYLQLFALLWLASQMLKSPTRHRTLMWFFSIGAAVSAAIAMSQAAIQGTFNTSIRAAGLLGTNSSARYFAVAFVLFVYLATSSKGLWRLAAVAGAAVVVGGEAATLSRSGAALLVLAAALLLWDRLRAGRRKQVFAVVAVMIVAVFLIPKSYLTVEIPSFGTSFNAQSSDASALIRFKLWTAGYRMWADHPVEGVGIGQFNNELLTYAPYDLPAIDYNTGAHNIYVAVLAETGVVGLALFVWLAVACYSAVRRAARSAADEETRQLARTWQIALIVLLLGGLTKHDQYDKLLWLTLGATLSFGAGYRYLHRRREPRMHMAEIHPVAR
jgi:O-antigen ligase